jgi:hypothetical protein
MISPCSRGLAVLMAIAVSIGVPLTSSTAASVSPSARQVTCQFGPVFSSAVFRVAPFLLEESKDAVDRQIIEALSAQNSDQQSAFGSYLKKPVRFVGVKDGYLRVYLQGSGSKDIFLVDGTSLRLVSSRSCRIRGVVDGRPALQWWIHNKAPKITRETKELRVLVQDDECGGGDLRSPRLLTSVTVTAKTVEVAFAARPIELPQPINPDGTPLLGPDGKPVAPAATCDGYPPSDITITLPVALGKRQLINTSLFPAKAPSRFSLRIAPSGPPPLPNLS